MVQIDWERTLVAKVAQTGKIQQVLSEGITDQHFANETLGEIFRFMADHARSYRQAPSFTTVKDKYPDHNFEFVDESLDYIRECFIKGVKRRCAIEEIRNLVGAIDNPQEGVEIDSMFLESARNLATVVPSSRLHRFSDMDKRIELYETEDPNLNKGIYTNIPLLDDLTQGIQPHEYVTIMGWTGTGKSTLAQWMLFNAWMQGKTPMYISLEMEASALLRKWDTMITNFQYGHLKSHTLRDGELANWKNKATEVKEKPNDIVILDDVRGCTADRVYGEIHRWRPDIVCIDYITLMDTGRGSSQMWEKVMQITQSLKQIARTSKVPIIGVAQTNRASAEGGAELNNVAFSSAIIQDSDIVLGLHSDKEMREDNRMQLRVLKNRDGMQGETDLLWDMSTMTFGNYRETQRFTERFRENG